jgi:hypothetical protein
MYLFGTAIAVIMKVFSGTEKARLRCQPGLFVSISIVARAGNNQPSILGGSKSLRRWLRSDLRRRGAIRIPESFIGAQADYGETAGMLLLIKSF